jgi:hypothetical protein
MRSAKKASAGCTASQEFVLPSQQEMGIAIFAEGYANVEQPLCSRAPYKKWKCEL